MKHGSIGKTSPAKSSPTSSSIESGQTDWTRVRALKDGDIQHDADSPRTNTDDWNAAVMKQAGTVVGTVRRRGPSKRAAKVSTTLRLPPEILAAWKATGPGWQTRMVEVLSKVVEKDD